MLIYIKIYAILTNWLFLLPLYNKIYQAGQTPSSLKYFWLQLRVSTKHIWGRRQAISSHHCHTEPLVCTAKYRFFLFSFIPQINLYYSCKLSFPVELGHSVKFRCSVFGPVTCWLTLISAPLALSYRASRQISPVCSPRYRTLRSPGRRSKTLKNQAQKASSPNFVVAFLSLFFDDPYRDLFRPCHFLM